MITRDDQVKILDFGLAKPIDTGGDGQDARPPASPPMRRHVLGNVRLHGAGTGARPRRRSSRRHVRVRRRALRDAERRARVQGGNRRGHDDRDPDEGPPELDTTRLAISPASIASSGAASRSRPISLPVRQRSRVRARDAVDRVYLVVDRGRRRPSVPPPRARRRGCRGPSPRRRSPRRCRRVRLAGFRSILRTTPSPSTLVDVHARSAKRPARKRRRLSPDGTTVAYAMRVNGSWDIYAQRVGGRNATPIVNDPQRDESGRLLPDGSLIAFHESDADGGIFVAGRDRRIGAAGDRHGFRSRVVARREADRVRHRGDRRSRLRLGDSTLYVVDAAGGTPRKLVDGDACSRRGRHPGQRIVYWSNTGGQRDIYTVAAAGGAPVRSRTTRRSTGRRCGRRTASSSTSPAIAAAR